MKSEALFIERFFNLRLIFMKLLYRSIFLFCYVSLLSSVVFAQLPQTYCNPLNLDYRFMSDVIDAREAADPVIVLYKGDYYLFASRSGGYWTSPDLHNWQLIVPTNLDIIETYAPSVVVLRDTLFYCASANGSMFKTADPKSGVWHRAPNIGSYGDPAMFVDDDGKLYMYFGLSNNNPTSVVELDPVTFQEIGSRVNIVFNMASVHGWERRGDDNLLDEQPWIEGTWMIKENNKYYMHYAAPGTEFKTYADGIYVGDSPLGPFTYADYSPFSFKPTGFITGAGHGCTFRDKDGKFWRIVTMVISVRHLFERRLGLYPVAVDQEGQIRCNTEFADYPQYLPGIKENPIDENFAGMMLLSHKKYVTASSELPGYGAERAVDEESRTYWAAQTGDAGEWLLLDLGKECSIQALQINFGEHGTDPQAVRGRNVVLFEQYTIETSSDGLNWTMLIDKSQNTKDVPHDYIELEQAVNSRYVRLTNIFTPGGGKFTVRGLRVFGNSTEAVFTPVNDFTVERSSVDGRDAIIHWAGVEGADGYIIRYGIAADKLYNHYMVYDVDSVAIHSLNHGVEYYFEVEAFDSGTDYYRAEGEFRSGQSGDWNDINSWEQNNGTEWVAASKLPDLGDGPVTILDGHTITVTTDDSADQLTIAPGGLLVVNTGVNFFVQNGIGNDLTINGELINSGNVTAGDEATIRFGDGGKYSHEQEGGVIPISIWGVGSTCEISNYVSGSKPGNLNQDFYNFLWNCTGQTSNVDWGWFNNNIGGDITVQSTGSAHAYVTSPGAGSPNTININGGINVDAGQFASNGSSSIAEITVNTLGNINVTGGNFSVSLGSGPTVLWNLFGNFSMSNATTQNSNPAGARFVFSGDGTRVLTLGEGNTLTALPIEVSGGTTLSMGTTVLSGAGMFQLNSGATLAIGHPDGLNGNLQISQTPLLSKGAGYSFNGSEGQVTGSLMPDAVAILIIDNDAGVALTNEVTVTDIFELKSGQLSEQDADLMYGENASLKYSGTSQTTSDIEFPEAGGPKNLIINSTNRVNLHASRTLSGNLEFQDGKLDVGINNLIIGGLTSGATPREYVDTDEGGVLGMDVGASQKIFPVGSNTYAPVWITNSGVNDLITVGVLRDSDPAPFGGRVRQKWNIVETVVGGGNYEIQFGWMSSAENTDFRADRQGNAKIFHLPDTIEAGSGSYTTQFDVSPFTVARGGITTLGEFVVGKFRDLPNAVEFTETIPQGFRLEQNYPNPFNPVTTITYDVPKDAFVKIDIYDILGRLTATLVNEKLVVGRYKVQWDASYLGTGVYFSKMEARTEDGAEAFNYVRKLILLK
jgi:xylan 1,4-beta-xylosidase